MTLVQDETCSRRFFPVRVGDASGSVQPEILPLRNANFWQRPRRSLLIAFPAEGVEPRTVEFKHASTRALETVPGTSAFAQSPVNGNDPLSNDRPRIALIGEGLNFTAPDIQGAVKLT